MNKRQKSKPIPSKLVRFRSAVRSLRSQAAALDDRRIKLIEERRDRQRERDKVSRMPLEYPASEAKESRRIELANADDEIAELTSQIEKLAAEADAIRATADPIGRTVESIHRYLNIDYDDEFIRADNYRVTA